MVAGAGLTAPTSLTAQVGGTDNLPIEDAWPTPADTGIALKPAGLGAAAGGGALLKSPVKPRMPAELAPC
jgi:hypothetical protein